MKDKKQRSLSLMWKLSLLGVILQPLWVGALTDDEISKKFKDLNAGFDSMQEKQQGQADKIDKKSDKMDVKESVDKLQRQISQLAAALEASKASLAGMSKELELLKVSHADKSNAMHERISKLEPRKITLDGQDFVVELNELRAYEDGLEMLRDNDYRAAKKSLTGFISFYPQSVLLAPAHFFLGGANKGLNDCKESILAWQVVVMKYASNPKVSAALLNIGTCQIELKDRSGAKRTFESIVEKFPATESAQTAKNNLLLMR
jgi:tol-pal system protein YbgF